jgi:porphobilinogen deaminase
MKATLEQAKAVAEIIKTKCGYETNKQEKWFMNATAFLQGDGSYAVDICVHSLPDVPESVKDRFRDAPLKDVKVYFRVVSTAPVYDFKKMDMEAALLKEQQDLKKKHRGK